MNGNGTKVVLTVYAPIATADAVRSALAAAGAGRIGKYVGCSFSAPGVGRFPAPAMIAGKIHLASRSQI